MLLSKKVDVYRKQDKVILQVSSGPAGWVSAIWSYCVKSERFELNVSLHSHGLTSLGSVGLRATHVSPLFLTHDSELTTLVHSPRAMLWHPSGERLVVIEGGRVFLFGITWISKTRRNIHEIQTTHINLKRATEIYSDQLEEEDRTEQEGHITTHETIGVRISLRQVSTHIGATAATLACTMFADISGCSSTSLSGAAIAQNQNNSTTNPANTLKPPTGTHSTGISNSTRTTATVPITPPTPNSHNGRILVGTESGAVLSVAWGLPGDDIHYANASTSNNTNNGYNATNFNNTDLDQSNHSVFTTSTLSYTQHGDVHDVFDLEDESRNRAHSYTNAGRLLATVVCAATSTSGISHNTTIADAQGTTSTTLPTNTTHTTHTEENRDLLRIWQKPVFRLSAQNNAPLNYDNLPEVLDIGDVGTFVDNRADPMVEVDLNVSNHSNMHEHSHVKGSSSYGTRVTHSATSVRELVCSDRNKCVLIVYGDGSFSVCMLAPVVVHVSSGSSGNSASVHNVRTPHSTLPTPRSTAHSTPHTIPTTPHTTLPTTTIHTFVVHMSAKIHPVVLVGYPLPPTPTVPSTNVSNSGDSRGSGTISTKSTKAETTSTSKDQSQPDVYQLGSSGAYRSTTYTTSFDVEQTLDLTSSLLQKVSRMRKLVTGRVEEEISRVLCVRIMYDTSVVHNSTAGSGSGDNNGALRIVALVQSKHMPALHSTYITQHGEVLSVNRQESLSLIVYDVGLYSVDTSTNVSANDSSVSSSEGREITCNVLHSVCIDRNITSTYTEPSMHLIHLPNVHDTHVLIHHADNRVSCRSMADLFSVVFIVNPVPLSPSPSLTTVSVCMNRIQLTVWDSHTHGHVDSVSVTHKHHAHTTPHTPHTTHTPHTPHYGSAKALHLPIHNSTIATYSRIVVLPILTSVVGKVVSQNNLLYADLTEGTLHTIDIEASQCTPLSTVVETETTHTTHPNTSTSTASTAVVSTDENTYNAPLLTTQLKLPRKLLTDIQHYHTLCSINNPFQPRTAHRTIQEGLLVACSKQRNEVVFDPVLYSKHGVYNTATSVNGSSGTVHTDYLAMIAGGSMVPYKQPTIANTTTATTTNTTTHNTYTNTTTTPTTRRASLLYVYNTTTHRWRSVYLTAGNRESSACLIKDIPTAHSIRKPENSQLYSGSGKRYSSKLAVSVDSGSGSGKHQPNPANTLASTNTTTLKSASVDSAHSTEHNTSPTISTNKTSKRRNSDNNITTTPVTCNTTNTTPTNASGKDTNAGFSVRSLFLFNNNATNSTANTNTMNTTNTLTYKHSISTPITARSQLAGTASSILSLAWYNIHTIVLLTLRRSTYCIEIISREASKASMSVGKLQPLVHKIVMLPPGYSPCSMECIVVNSSGSTTNSESGGNANTEHTPHTTNTIFEGNEDSDTDSVSSDNSLFDDTTNSAINSAVHSVVNSTFSLQVPTPHSVHSVPSIHTPHSVRSVSSTGTNNNPTQTTSSGINGCVVVVSDNTTLLCYHIQAQGTYTTSTTASSSKGSAKVNTTTNASNTVSSKGSVQITDYHVTELWDTNLTTLTLNNTSTTTTIANTSPTNGTSDDSKLHSAGVQFPIREVKVFVQNVPLHDQQVDGFQRLSSTYHSTLSVVPLFPVVSLFILDYAGNLYSIDAECSVCTYVRSNVSKISVLSSCEVCMNRIGDGSTVTGTSGSSVLNSVVGEPLLLHNTYDPAADAQRHLLYIFTKTSLIQHIRPHALHTKLRLHYANTLHIPVNMLVKHSVDKNDVHTFDEGDLQRRRSRVYTHTGYVTIQLSTLHNTLLHTTRGMMIALGTKHVNISEYMRNRNNTTHDTTNTTSVLQFLPYLCTAFNNTLHNVVDNYETPTVQLHLHDSVDVPVNHTLHTTLYSTLLHTLTTHLLQTTRSTTTYTALLIAYLEHIVMQYTLTPNFNYKHTHYARLTQFLYAQDPTLLGEILTRVGRKLEPAVSHLLFPVTVYSVAGNEDTIAPYTTSILRLYESFLTTHHYHHTARVLSLACECIGGSESHISTAASLILALELLQASVRSVSLRNSIECVEFCVRLESMLVMHSRAIFGEGGSGSSPRTSRKHSSSTNSGISSSDTNANTTSTTTRTLDNSYTSTVKSKALSLIHYTRDRVYRQTVQTIHSIHNSKSNNSMQHVFTPTAAASPALPFYLGMGVGWILTKAVNSLIPETSNTSTVTTTSGSSNGNGNSNGASGGGISSIGATNATRVSVGSNISLNVNTTTNNSTNPVQSVYTTDDLLRQCMVPTASHVHTNNTTLIHTSASSIASTTNTSANSVYQYSVIDALEHKYGSAALSQMLSRTQLPAAYSSGSISSSGVSGVSSSTINTPNTTAISPPSITTNNTNTTPLTYSANYAGVQSPTALLLVLTLTDMFRSSTHYCNAAALLVALLQHSTSIQLLHHYLLTMYDTTTHTNNTDASTSVGADSSEKVRRILYVYRLNKVLSRTSITGASHTTSTTNTTQTNESISNLLTQRVSAQYLRRIIEADTIHYNTTTHGMNNSSHGSPRYSAVNKVNIGETPRTATSGGVSGSSEQWSGERRAGYFELTEELLVHNKSATSDTNGGGDTTPSVSPSHLTILTILKSLSVGLLLVGDSAAAGLLLHTILPHIARVDSVLHSALLHLPRVSSVGSSSASNGTTSNSIGGTSSASGASNDSSIDGGSADSTYRQVWVLNTEQLNSLFNALVS